MVSSRHASGHLPNTGSKSRYCKPLQNVLNTIGHEYCKVQVKPGTVSYCPIIAYKRQKRKSEIDGAAAGKLEPDLVGLIREVPNMTERQHFSWTEISVPIEVGDDWKDLTAQLAIYGRAILNAHPSRTFALGIAFNRIDKCARFLFFHRGGLHSTSAFDLKTDNGVDGFIHGVCVATALQHKLCSWTLTRAGKQFFYDKSEPEPPFRFRAEKCVYQRISLIGRCTAAWLLKSSHSSPIAPDAKPIVASHSSSINPTTPYILRPKRKRSPPAASSV